MIPNSSLVVFIYYRFQDNYILDRLVILTLEV
ncbi:hypothetical protein Vi05172_g13697 [Venturia inaequalis]|nr:hypothetical protein Vi05172_g13697 [Venturia inaequalis]